MNAVSERCATCGVLPDWHLVWRGALSRAVQEAREAGQPEPKGYLAMWRNIHWHEPNRPCARFNGAWSKAPLSQAPPEALFQRGTQRQPAEDERGDAWEAA